jgi:excisionase family DNA binding protein
MNTKHSRPICREKLAGLPILLTIPEAADYYSISERTVRRHIDAGIFESERIGSRVRVRIDGHRDPSR